MSDYRTVTLPARVWFNIMATLKKVKELYPENKELGHSLLSVALAIGVQAHINPKEFEAEMKEEEN